MRQKSGSREGGTPLVSVVIPCYNHGHYLPEAIESVLAQSYPHVEVVVVNDGSTDNTAEVAAAYPQVRYVHQPNQGLSATRNTGVRHSRGEFLVFLDADDWLLPQALETNVRYLLQNPQAAFVSGAYANIFENDSGRTVTECRKEVNADHYYYFLQYNYIGMIATVLFRRWVFDEFLYDVTLRGSEDHDLYLKVSRKYSVVHHTAVIAAYRRHGANMSADIPMMVVNAMIVLRRQQGLLQTNAEKQAYASYYEALYQQFVALKTPVAAADYNIFKEDSFSLYKYRLFASLTRQVKRTLMLKSKLKKHMPAFILRRLYSSGLLANPHPAEGQVRLGDLNRTTPLSKTFGYDRGGAIDRYYIEEFLMKSSASIRGNVLEIGENTYTMSFGGEKVAKSDILHVDESNQSATIIGDISDAPHIADNTFDCLIFTQTLHLIYNFREALQTCHRILKPGGTLLLTVPYITSIDHDEWKETWYWSFTDKAMKRLMAETFPGGEAEVRSYGNVFAATTFLYGMGLSEVPKEKLDYHDQHFQVIITVKAVKK